MKTRGKWKERGADGEQKNARGEGEQQQKRQGNEQKKGKQTSVFHFNETIKLVDHFRSV